MDLSVVALGSLSGDRLRHHLRLPVCIHVYHRFLPAVRCVCSHFCCTREIPGRRRYDGRGNPDVPESRNALDVDGARYNQRSGDANTLHPETLGAILTQEEQVGYCLVGLTSPLSGGKRRYT